MERLLDIARKKAGKVEVYGEKSTSDDVSFENSKLKDIESSIQSGVGLLLMQDGKVGYAYTRNLVDREGLVQNALDALKGGAEADYDLPLTKDVPELDTYDGSIEKLSTTGMVEECNRVCGVFAGKTSGQLNTSAGSMTTEVRVLNSAGTDLNTKSSSYYAYAALNFPGSYSSIFRMVTGKGFTPLSDEDTSYVLNAYEAAQKEVKVPSGKMKVLFLPSTMYTLVWRLLAATGGKNVYEKVSPLKDKVGEKVMSERLTVVDTPLDDAWPGARAFDDEGTACRETPIVEAGILKGFYFDRYYAWKAGVEPTGHGFRPGVTSRVSPGLEHLTIEPGKESFAELLKAMDKGIIVGGVLGAHSGNLLNGDFSVGLAPGLYVEGGEIAGQVKDAMVAGNIYDTMQRVVGIENRVHPGYMGRFPAVLLEDVSFASKG